MHTSENLITNERLRQPAPIDGDPVVSLAVSPYEADLSFLQRMFDDADWKLFTAHTYKEGMAELSRELIPVVLCECQLPDGNWKDVLSRLAPMLEPPRLIAVSHHADERLWLEVLNLVVSICLQHPSMKSRRGMQLGRRGSIGNTHGTRPRTPAAIHKIGRRVAGCMRGRDEALPQTKKRVRRD